VTKKQWTAVLKDGTEVTIKRADSSDSTEVLKIAKEMAIQSFQQLGRHFLSKKPTRGEVMGILSRKTLEITDYVKSGKYEILLARKDGEVIGFAFTHGTMEIPELLKQLFDFDELTKKGIRVIKEARTYKYKRKGLNRCLILMTLLSRPEKIFYTPITSEHAEGLVKMFKNISDKCNMKFEKGQEKSHYGIHLEKNEDSNELLKKALKKKFSLEY